jgi:hypothetical protein
MKRLTELGFKKVGKWSFENDLFNFELNDTYVNKNILYSFVIKNEIKYIGKSIKTISQRLNGYRKPNISQRTNFRLNNLIIEKLKTGQEVEIYLFLDNAELSYRGHKINLSAGLEDNLIAEFLPEWNYLGKSRKLTQRKNITKIYKSEEIMKIEPKETIYEFGRFKEETQIEVHINYAYYNQGFFNIKKQFSDLFGENKSSIRIQLGNKPENIIQGYVNRTANGKHGYPRIMAGKYYKYWIQENFKEGDILKIRMTEKDYIILTK